MIKLIRNMFVILLVIFLVSPVYAQVGTQMQGAIDDLAQFTGTEDFNSSFSMPTEETTTDAAIDAALDAASAPNGSIILDVLDLKNIDILDVLKLISQKSGINIIASQNVTGRVTVFLKNITVDEALKTIVEAYGWAFAKEGDIIKVMTAADYEAKYGMKFGQQSETVVRRLLYTSTADLLAVLNQIKSASGKIITDEKSGTLILVDGSDKIVEMTDIIKKLDVPSETKVFQLSYASADDVAKKIIENLTPQLGSVRSDERTNRLVIRDTVPKMKEIEKIVSAFDRQDRQVLIEAKILQITLSDDFKLGVDWQGIVDGYQELTFNSNFDILNAADKGGKVSIGVLEDDGYTALVEALETVGVTDILSSPRVLTINNKEAKILVGSTEPYVTSTTTTPASGPTTTSETVNFIEVGVKLFVTPTIHEDDFISMKIKPEVSSVTGTISTGTNNLIPVVETSEAETTVRVKNGVTVVIGGLIKDEKLTTNKKVPLLGDIPLLGAAFRSQSDSVTKTEIAIFLKPTIVDGDIADNVSVDHSNFEGYEHIQIDKR